MEKGRLEMSRGRDLDLSYHAHKKIYFSVFCVSNFLLSYPSWGLETKIWIGLLGLVFPLAMAFSSLRVPGQKETPFWKKDLGGAAPVLVWILLGFFWGMVLFCQVEIFPLWPVPDEGTCAFPSLELAEGGALHFFYTQAQVPPLFNWLLGLFFKVLVPSIFSLRLFPTLFMVATVLCACFFVKAVWGKSPALLTFCLLAFCFCSLYTGRFCMSMIVVLFWEVFTFGLLALFLKNSDPAKVGRQAFVLGLCCGAGLFISIAAILVLFLVGMAVFQDARERGGVGPFVLFSVPALAWCLLFTGASWAEGNGEHARYLWAFHSGMDPWQQVIDSFSHVTGLFWGGDFKENYGPLWGGMLNPVLGAAFFLGVLELVPHWRSAFVRWFFLGTGLLLVPGLVTVGREIFRIVQVFPFLLLSCGIGILALASTFPRKYRPILLTLLFSCSSGLDLYHLWLSERRAGGPLESHLFPRAYEILRRKARTQGPGALFFDTKIHVADETLSLATYPFDTSRNPRFSLSAAKWMAIVLNEDFRPFLAKRFPDGEWFPLDRPDLSGRGTGEKWMLGVIPVRPENKNELERWAIADKAFREVVWSLANPSEKGSKEIFGALMGSYATVQGDPLLESLYWRMVFDAHNWESSFGDRDEAKHFAGALAAMRNAVQGGYPDADSLNELGVLLTLKKDYRGAREAFSKAVRCQVNDTPANDNLVALDRLEASVKE